MKTPLFIKKKRFILCTSVVFGFVLFVLSPAHAEITLNKTLSLPANLSGLVAWYTMDGVDTSWTGSTTIDKSGNGNTGTLTNMTQSTAPAAGKIGQGFKFSGISDQYVNIGSASGIDDIELQNGYMSISAWIKPSATGYFISKGPLSFNGTWYVRAIVAGGFNNIDFGKVYSGTDLAVRTSANTIKADRWNHIIVVWDGTEIASNVNIYVNGSLVSHTIDTNGTGSKSSDASDNLTVGGMPSGANMKGVLDDARIYNRALSTTEIQQLYNQGTAGKQNISIAAVSSGLVGWWTMDGKDTPWTSATAATTLDRSGNSNTGTLTNMSQSSSPVSGRVGQGLKFDGSNDYIDAGNASALQLSNVGTVSLWFKHDSNNTGFRAFVRKDDYNNDINGYGLGKDSTGLHAQIANTTTRNAIGTATPYTDNKWHHAVFSWDGSFLYLYVDGASAATPVSQTVNAASTLYNLTIGKNAAVSQQYHNGYLDDVRIYNRALSTTEIQQLYNQGK